MSDKKLPKIKHNHTLTDILKASIFSLVMMAPIAAIGITCAYVVCNKNAYQSYSGSIERYDRVALYENGKIINDELEEHKTYRLIYDNLSYLPGSDDYLDLAVVSADYFYIETYEENIDFTIYDNVFNLFIDENGVMVNGYYVSYIETNILVDVAEVRITDSNTFQFIHEFFNETTDNVYSYELVNVSTLDNVFYYAVDTMQNNTLFSWTKTTAIYTPVNAMTTGMGINTPAIAVLLVYWLLCTAVYIIINIVVKGFTWLTHLIGER